MPNVICNTSPLQYLHQLDQLHLLPALVKQVIVPQAVTEEIAAGKEQGINLPNPAALEWVMIQRPASAPALPLITDLGPGETEVLMLALELPDALVILDDGLARRVAEMCGLRLTGTLGLLIDAKRAGLISAVRPLLDQLQALRFFISTETRHAVLKMVGEA